jgi:hypothetical protein
MQLEPARASNPFLCFIDPHAAVEAHRRLTTTLIAGSRLWHPLDNIRPVRGGQEQEALVAFDDEVEADSAADIITDAPGPNAVS